MQAPNPDRTAQLQSLRRQARDDASRDIAIVHAWQPEHRGHGSSREQADWLFVAAQVLTVAELWSPAGS